MILKLTLAHLLLDSVGFSVCLVHMVSALMLWRVPCLIRCVLVLVVMCIEGVFLSVLPFNPSQYNCNNTVNLQLPDDIHQLTGCFSLIILCPLRLSLVRMLLGVYMG